MNQANEMQPRVQILGAGIAGLSLASYLRASRISYKLFDAAPATPGHNYGISLAPWAYRPLLDVLDPKLTVSDFRKTIGVDKLVGGHGSTIVPQNATQEVSEDVRVSDTALRTLLIASAHDNQIQWSHRLAKVHKTSTGIQLSFENGQTSCAPITIDASGERSSLLSALLEDETTTTTTKRQQEQQPEVLPYAVYHGTRFVPHTQLESEYPNLFPGSDNVRDWTIRTDNSTTQHFTSKNDDDDAKKTCYYIQISRAYVEFSALPGPIQDTFRHTEHTSETEETTFVELRYTISRAALTSTSTNPTAQQDPIFNANRSKSDAKQIPPAFYQELDTLVTEIAAKKETKSLSTLLSASKIHQDRVLNWLMRVRKPASKSLLQTLAHKHGFLVLGDAAHPLPIMGSEGAGLAMRDAHLLGQWLRMGLQSGNDGQGEEWDLDLARFYDDTKIVDGWVDAERRSRAWLRIVHGQDELDLGNLNGMGMGNDGVKL